MYQECQKVGLSQYMWKIWSCCGVIGVATYDKINNVGPETPAEKHQLREWHRIRCETGAWCFCVVNCVCAPVCVHYRGLIIANTLQFPFHCWKNAGRFLLTEVAAALSKCWRFLTMLSWKWALARACECCHGKSAVQPAIAFLDSRQALLSLPIKILINGREGAGITWERTNGHMFEPRRAQSQSFRGEVWLMCTLHCLTMENLVDDAITQTAARTVQWKHDSVQFNRVVNDKYKSSIFSPLFRATCPPKTLKAKVKTVALLTLHQEKLHQHVGCQWVRIGHRVS